MEDNAKLLESLLVKVTDYGKTSLELVKLKALDKTTDVVSSFIPVSAVFVIIASFMLFLNVGLAFWLGEILGKIFFGFFMVAAFYLIIGGVLYLLMKNWIKKIACNYIIKLLLK
ncbi:MAG: phage holin family protein [Bacteroidetes bacterium]|nr:phage holin family protein [Bacteroidota bacterium]